MPKMSRSIGSGMTEQGIVKFDWADSDDVQGLIRAATETSRGAASTNCPESSRRSRPGS